MWAQGHHKNTDVQLNRFKCNISKKAITHGRDTFTKIKEQSIDASDAPSAPSLGISLLSVGVGIFIKIKKRESCLSLLSLLSHPLSSCRGWSLAAASLTILMRIQSPFSTSILILLSPQFSGTCIYSFMGLPHPSEPLHLIFILQYFIRLALCLASHSVAPFCKLPRAVIGAFPPLSYI